MHSLDDLLPAYEFSERHSFAIAVAAKVRSVLARHQAFQRLIRILFLRAAKRKAERTA